MRRSESSRRVSAGTGRRTQSHSRWNPPTPTGADVVQCLVRTSLVTEDPDYDVVAYRYRWRVGAKLVRDVTSAALSDVLRHGLARPGRRLSCTATPSDGKRRGPSAGVSVTVR